MQQGYRTIETGFNALRAGRGEVNGTHFPFGDFMMVALVVAAGYRK
jgi:hypothetical protein